MSLNRILLQALPEIEPFTFEGGPIFAEIGPIVLDQAIWAKSKKMMETGGFFKCRIIESSLTSNSPRKADVHLHLFPKSKEFSLRNSKEETDIIAFDLSKGGFGFEIERKGRPNEFRITKGNEAVMKVALNDINDRDPAVMALRMMLVLTDSSLAEAVDQKDYVRLCAEIQQLQSINARLLEDKESDRAKIQEIKRKEERFSKTEKELEKQISELEERDKKSSMVALNAQETIDCLSREKQFFYNVLLIFHGPKTKKRKF